MGSWEKGEGGGRSNPQRYITAIALFSLIQNMLVIAGAAVGLVACSCSSSISSNSEIWQQVGLYYFRSDCQEHYKVGNNTYSVKKVNEASRRTKIILWVYIGLNIMWFMGNILLLVSSIKGKHMKPSMGKLLHSVWLITTILILLYDVIVTILYLLDLNHTLDNDDLIRFLELFLTQLDIKNRSIPTVIMAVLFSKGVLLLLIDLILVILIRKQFQILLSMREETQFLQAHSSTPSYLWPPQLQKQNPHLMKDGSVEPPIPVLPRLTNLNGKFVGNHQSEMGNTMRSSRPSALQKAARQGFNYEDPASRPWSTASSVDDLYSPRSTPHQGFSFGGPPSNIFNHNGYIQEPSGMKNSSYRNHERPASLQKDIDVFY